MGKSKNESNAQPERRTTSQESIADYRSCRFGIGGCHAGGLFLLRLIQKINMPQEIERKISRKRRIQVASILAEPYHSGYISSARGRTVRVRIRGGQGYLTIKGASDASGISRYEWEKEIPLNEAEELMKLCEPGVIDKTRYLIRSGNHVFEVDEFYGENEGLVVAEVELASENEPFEKPDFIGQEVTGDIRYYNSQLMKHPFKE